MANLLQKVLYSFPARLIMAIIVTVVGAAYLGYRVYQLSLVRSRNPLPYLFIMFEIAFYLSAEMFFLDMLWTYAKRRKPEPLPVDEHFKWPTVDIFIACCKEPTELVKDTALTALWQDYPAEKFTVNLLDDGKDDDLKEWAETERALNGTNLRYIRRTKLPQVPHHAKAGNINHALGVTTGEFIAVLDADMLIKPEFLRKMLAQFIEDDIAFVQCPQYYYNVPDGDSLGHVCSFFYQSIMTQRDTRNSVPSVGTGVVFRRTALESIGGISTGTLTEDFDTSLKLHGAGFKTVYNNEKLQFGLVPNDYGAYVRQRERWALGSLQIFFKRNPLFLKNDLSFHQRLMYFSAGFYYLLPLGTLIFVCVPLLVLFFNWPVMPVAFGDYRTLMILLVPYIFCSRYILYMLYANVENSLTGRNRDFQTFVWQAPYLFVALVKFIFSAIVPAQFKVTNSKKKSKSIFDHNIWLCWFHILYLIAAVAAMAYRLFIWNPTKCVDRFSYFTHVLYSIYGMQAMAAPVLYVLFEEKSDVDEEVERKKRITYNEYGVPIIDLEKIKPKQSRWVWGLEIIPIVWCVSYVLILVGLLTDFDFQCTVEYNPTE